MHLDALVDKKVGLNVLPRPLLGKFFVPLNFHNINYSFTNIPLFSLHLFLQSTINITMLKT
jgi:hypothetical protein